MEKDEMEKFIETLKKCNYPPALSKACEDTFDYELKLSSGERIRFESATPINQEWVTIQGIRQFHPSIGRCFERGIDLKVSTIMWVADAPEGS